MDVMTGCYLVLICVVLVGGYLMGKELDLRKPTPSPLPQQSDSSFAIAILQQQLESLSNLYESNEDSSILEEIGKINATLAAIASKPSDTMCKCGAKKS